MGVFPDDSCTTPTVSMHCTEKSRNPSPHDLPLTPPHDLAIDLSQCAPLMSHALTSLTMPSAVDFSPLIITPSLAGIGASVLRLAVGLLLECSQGRWEHDRRALSADTAGS